MSPFPPSERPEARAAGFTLVEMLVAVAVAAIIMVVLMQSLSQAASSWIGQSKSFSIQREARSGLRLLSDDLAALAPLPEGPVTAGSDGRTRFFLAFPPDSHGSARLAFLRASRPEPVDATQPVRGDVRLVLYGTALTSDGGASSTAVQKATQKLMRRVLTAEQTFQRIKDHLEKKTPLATEDDWAALAAGDAITEALAYDVIRFEVQPWDTLPAPNATPLKTWKETMVPAWVDVTLRVTNRATAALLETTTDWTGQGAIAELLTNGTPDDYADDREVRTYAMRVSLDLLPSP